MTYQIQSDRHNQCGRWEWDTLGYILKLNGKNEDLEIVLENPGSLKVSGTLCCVRAGV